MVTGFKIKCTLELLFLLLMLLLHYTRTGCVLLYVSYHFESAKPISGLVPCSLIYKFQQVNNKVSVIILIRGVLLFNRRHDMFTPPWAF